METQSTSPKRPWYTHPLAVVLTALGAIVGVLILIFVWHVFSFYRLIESGAIANLPQFTSRLTVGNFREQSNLPIADVVTKDDPSVGLDDAPVTIVEFYDFECPFSQESFLTVRQILNEYPNDVRFIFRDFPIDTLHPNARAAARAVNCAAEQDKFLSMHDKLFQNASRLSESDLKFYAQQIGLNKTIFDRCMNNPKTSNEIDRDITDGTTAGVRGTPTFFINGSRIEGAVPYAILKQIVEQLKQP